MAKYRYSLRNQMKLKNSFGEDFLKWLILSLNEKFKQDIIEEYQYANEKFKIINVDNVQPKTDSFFEFYIIGKTYNTFHLAYKSCAG